MSAASRGTFLAFREDWNQRTGPVDPTPALAVLATEEPRSWPTEILWEPSATQELPGPPGGYTAGLVAFHKVDGTKVATAAAVGDQAGLRVPLPEVPHPLLGRWELPTVSLALPGAIEYHLGARGLSAWFPASPRRAGLAVRACGTTGLKVRAKASVPWIEVDQPAELTLPAGGEDILGLRVLGAPADAAGEVHVKRGRVTLARVRVVVRPDPEVVRCDLQVAPADLGTVSTQTIELQLRVRRVSGAGPVEGWILVSTVPEVTTIPVCLEEGRDLWEDRLELPPERLPRGERGSLAVRLVARGQVGAVHAVPFRRLCLRRNLARVDLRFGSYEPHPFGRLGFRRSDGQAVCVALTIPADLHAYVEVRRVGEARFLVIGRQPPPDVLEGTLLAREEASGLEERVPLRLDKGGRLGS